MAMLMANSNSDCVICQEFAAGSDAKKSLE